MPRLRNLPFETEIIERYRRRESSIEEAMIEMYLAGVSVRRVEDITEALWGTRGQPEHGQRAEPEDLRSHRRLAEPAHRGRASLRVPRRDLAEAGLGRRSGRTWRCWWRSPWARDGYREILGVCEGTKEDKESWRNFLRHLKERGLKGVRLIISDKCLGLVEALGEFFPEAAVAAVRGPLVSQRVYGRAQGQGQSGGGDAQGDPCPGRPPGGAAGRPRTW